MNKSHLPAQGRRRRPESCDTKPYNAFLSRLDSDGDGNRSISRSELIAVKTRHFGLAGRNKEVLRSTDEIEAKKALLLTSLLILSSASATADTIWTAKGRKGGGANGTAACAAGNHSVNCPSSSSFTNATDRTATRPGQAMATGNCQGSAAPWSAKLPAPPTIAPSTAEARVSIPAPGQRTRSKAQLGPATVLAHPAQEPAVKVGLAS